MREIVRDDWSIDTNRLRLTERGTVDWINRRRVARRRRRRLRAFFRRLWRCDRPESARAIAGGKWRGTTDG